MCITQNQAKPNLRISFGGKSDALFDVCADVGAKQIQIQIMEALMKLGVKIDRKDINVVENKVVGGHESGSNKEDVSSDSSEEVLVKREPIKKKQDPTKDKFTFVHTKQFTNIQKEFLVKL
eukprot:UN32617